MAIIAPSMNGASSTMQDYQGVYLNSNLPTLPPKIVTGPYDYVVSLPSKGRRSLFTGSLNYWLNVSNGDVREINGIIDTLHNASLMIDDIQDESPQRRGRPSTHMVFGVAQTINSAMFYINEAMASVQRLCGQDGVQAALEQLGVLYMGQGYDIHSSQNMACPTVDEYIRTIDGKTGALFELIARLMFLKTPTGVDSPMLDGPRTQCLPIEVDSTLIVEGAENNGLPTKPKFDYSQIQRLVILLGRYYQLRDDYKTFQLPTEDTAVRNNSAAPWCEDLDGGKYTLPLIHLLQSGQDEHLIRSVLSTRHAAGKMDDASKHLLLDHMQKAGSLEYTLGVLETVHQEMVAELERVNYIFGSENKEMRLLIDMLKV